jgi:hypothetical protein
LPKGKALRNSASRILVLALLLNSLLLAPAQSLSPSYEEARNWIVAKINQVGGASKVGPGQWSVSYDSVSMDNCELKYDVLSRDEEGHGGRYGVRIELGKVELDESKWPEMMNQVPVIRFFTKMQGIHIQDFQSRGRDKRWSDADYTSAEYGYSFNSLVFARPGSDPSSMQPRVKKALLHAIGICKQRYVPPKEPF